MATSDVSVPGINTQYKVIVGTVTGVIIANTAVVLRLLARRAAKLRLRLDDFFICCALVSLFRAVVRSPINYGQLLHWGIAVAGIFRKTTCPPT